jgi:hypothetical protein
VHAADLERNRWPTWLEYALVGYNENMPENIQPGDCVKIPDGRIARVRENTNGLYRVRVRRKTSQNHQFLQFPGEQLVKITCPTGWMSPEGYNRYLKITLEKQLACDQKPK